VFFINFIFLIIKFRNGGIECIGCNIEYELCNKQPCIEVKKVGQWTNWLIANNSESGYLEKRYRYMCKAPVTDPSTLKISLMKEESRTCSNEGNCHRLADNVQKPTWGCWTDYSPCSVSCGTGKRIRYRKCLTSNGETAGDKECGSGQSVQEETCEMPSCDCKYNGLLCLEGGDTFAPPTQFRFLHSIFIILLNLLTFF
jgi:semaphorin 5